MKRNVIAVFLLSICWLSADPAFADSIKGRFGISGRIGFLVPADNEEIATGTVIGTSRSDVGFIGGGGLVYGITDNIAADLEITHASFSTDADTDFDTTSISMGVQYRFLNLPVKKLVPYAGAGLDILVNGANHGLDVDTVTGLHLKAGADYFVMRELALTSEIKGVIASNADITVPGSGKVGEFDPNNFSMTFGIRYFFN